MAVGLVGSTFAVPPTLAAATRVPPEILVEFQWIDTLGIPDVRDCPLVRISTGHRVQPGNAPAQNLTVDGFLLAPDDRGGFRAVATHLFVDAAFSHAAAEPEVFTTRYQATPPGTPELQRVSYRELSLTDETAAYLGRLTEKQPRRKDVDAGGGSANEQINAVFWAWACWRQGLTGEAVRLYRQAARIQPSLSHFRLEEGFGRALFQEAIHRAANPAITRSQMLASFRRIAQTCPSSEESRRARGEADRLRDLIAEDAAHAGQAAIPVQILPPDKQVAELIFRLRDQTTLRVNRLTPLSIDVPPGSPAAQLAALRFAAVPGLLAALNDRRPTRAYKDGYPWRSFDRSVFPVATVGDFAREILEEIAARTFLPQASDDVDLNDSDAARWWEEVQHKSERQTLLDKIAAGAGHDSEGTVASAQTLLERYPEAGLEPIIRAARNLPKGNTASQQYAALVTLIGMTSGDTAVPFLEAELREHDSVIAAIHLWRRGHRDEALTAMIRRWVRQRGRPEDSTQDDVGAHPDVLPFLAGCRRVEAIAALGHNLRGQRFSVRWSVAEALASDEDEYNLFLDGRHPGKGDGSDAAVLLNAARERVLASLLDDTESKPGKEILVANVPRIDPRICDLAARGLAHRFPGKYRFDFSEDQGERERQCLECLNVWRKSGAPEIRAP